jgi:hypothetical protein
MDGRAFASVENAKLYARSINSLAHQTVQSIHLSDNLTFGQAANGWITGHFSNLVGTQG